MMVAAAFAMAKVCATAGAAAKVVSPACDAVIMQLPEPVKWTRLPATVQLPLALTLTGGLEEAVALTLKSGSPYVLSASTPNVIVWLNLTATVALLLTAPRLSMTCRLTTDGPPWNEQAKLPPAGVIVGDPTSVPFVPHERLVTENDAGGTVSVSV